MTVKDETDQLSSLISKIVFHSHDLKGIGVNNSVRQLFIGKTKRIMKSTITRDEKILWNNTLSSTLSIIFNVLFIMFGMYLVINDSISLGLFVAFSSFSSILSTSLKKSVAIIVKWSSDKVTLDRIYKFIDLSDSILSEEKQKITLLEPIRKVEFCNVAFSLGTKIVIENLSFSLEPGAMISIVGENGSGKTTLLNLFDKSLIPSSGQIRINGCNLEDISFLSYQSKVAYFRQRSILYPISIIDNLLLNSNKDCCHQKAIFWCKELGLYNEILSRENGFETIISEFENLSIGQVQKVLLIRSMVKDAELILLDEPTSNLDFESRSAFLRTLKIAFQNKIIVFVTHSPEESFACDYCIHLPK